MTIKFIPEDLYFSNFGEQSEWAYLEGSLFNGEINIGNSRIDLNEEESETIRTVIRKASIRQNKLIN